MMILLVVLTVFYFISVYTAAHALIDKDVEISFSLFVLALLQIVNTYIAIRYGESFKEIKEKLKD